jgi:hypothetical protein
MIGPAYVEAYPFADHRHPSHAWVRLSVLEMYDFIFAVGRQLRAEREAVKVSRADAVKRIGSDMTLQKHRFGESGSLSTNMARFAEMCAAIDVSPVLVIGNAYTGVTMRRALT